MIGMVLAAGAGRRLRPYTDTLPKALVPVDGDTTILDIALRNLAAVELTDVVIVVGYAAGAVEERQAALEQRHGVTLTLVHNDKAEEWNNAYSLWLARDHFAEGALLVNGDTVHPVSVEETLLGARGPGHPAGRRRREAAGRRGDEGPASTTTAALTRITKLMDPADGLRRVHRRHAHRAGRGRARSPTRCRPPSSATRTSTTRTATRRWSTAASRIGIAPIGGHRLGRGRQPRRPGEGTGDRVPVLARMLAEPPVRRHPAGRGRGPRRRCCTSATSRARAGSLVAVGRSQGAEIWRADRAVAARARPSSRCPTAASPPPARSRRELGKRGYDAVVGIGGGRTSTSPSTPRTRAALPMVAVATNLAHDGICSPVASLEHPHGKGSYGVALPLAVVVDLDFVACRAPVSWCAPASATWSATCPRSRTGCSPSASAASRSTAWRWRSPGPRARRSCAAPTRSRTTTSSSRWPRRWCCPAWRCRWPAPRARAAARATRSCTPSTSSSPGTSNHGELAGVGALFATIAAR